MYKSIDKQKPIIISCLFSGNFYLLVIFRVSLHCVDYVVEKCYSNDAFDLNSTQCT